jgi:hypothetical protein
VPDKTSQRLTWQPSHPLSVGGRPLNADEAWLMLFGDQWFQLSGGQANLEEIAFHAIRLFERHPDRDPAQVAREVFAARVQWSAPD